MHVYDLIATYLSLLATKLRVEKSEFDSQRGLEIIILATVSRPTLDSTQPPIQCVMRVLFVGKSSRGVKLTIHPRLMLRSIMRGVIPPPSDTFLWR